MSRVITGVRSHFSAMHRKPGGDWHGHTWTVTAWWPEGPCAEQLFDRLNARLAHYDEERLPDHLSRGEAIARDIGENLSNCVRVDLERGPEGILARWEA